MGSSPYLLPRDPVYAHRRTSSSPDVVTKALMLGFRRNPLSNVRTAIMKSLTLATLPLIAVAVLGACTTRGGTSPPSQAGQVQVPASQQIDQQLGWEVLPKTKFEAYNPAGAISDFTISFQDIWALDENTAWAVGTSALVGAIYHTTDGRQFEIQNSGTPSGLTGVSFVDAQRGWAVGTFGTVIRTTDGGQNWELLEGLSVSSLEDVFFTDANAGWAVGAGGTIFHTTDGADSWIGQESGVTDKLQDVVFVDRQTGWAVGWGGTVLYTGDGGNTWKRQDSDTDVILWRVSFPDSDHGTVVGEGGTILRTADGGKTWTQQHSGTTEDLFGVFLLDTQTGWSVGARATILQTTDGGATWVPRVDIPVIGGALKAVWFASPESGLAVGSANFIAKFGPVAKD